jgi:copper chaperone NosL
MEEIENKSGMNYLKILYRILIVWAVTLSIISCNSNPEPIEFGKDQCAFCKMTIVDEKFGSELITPQGRVLKYDAAECMAQDIGNDGQEFSALYAIALDQPGKLVLVDSLKFVIHESIRSPMGANLGGFIGNVDEKYLDSVMTWPKIVQRLKK